MDGGDRQQRRLERNAKQAAWLVDHRVEVYVISAVLFVLACASLWVLIWNGEESPLYRVPIYAVIGAAAAVVVQTRRAAKNSRGD
jgi:hypothetical protein